MAAAAFLLAVGQLGNALGVHDKGNGHMQVLRRVWLTVFRGDPINYRALTLSVAAVLLAVALRKLLQRFGWPQIDMLAVLVITALIAYLAGWSTPGAGVVPRCHWRGRSRAVLPTPHIPEVHIGWLPELSTSALAIAFVGIIEALSIAKAIAHQTQQKIDYNRQIMAEGLANLAGGFFQSLPGSVTIPIGDQLPVRCGDAILRNRLGRNGGRGTAAFRPAAALRSAAGIGRAVAGDRRSAGRLQTFVSRSKRLATTRVW